MKKEQAIIFSETAKRSTLTWYSIGISGRGVHYSSAPILSINKTTHAMVLLSNYHVDNGQGGTEKLLETIIDIQELKDFIQRTPSLALGRKFEAVLDKDVDFIMTNMAQHDFHQCINEYRLKHKITKKIDKSFIDWWQTLSEDKDNSIHKFYYKVI